MRLRFSINRGQYTWADIVTIEVPEEDIPPDLRALIEERLVNEIDVCMGAASSKLKIVPATAGLDGSVWVPLHLDAKEATWESLKESLRKDAVRAKEDLEREVWKTIGIDPIDPRDVSDN